MAPSELLQQSAFTGIARASVGQELHMEGYLTCIVFRSQTEMLLSKRTVTPTLPLLDTANDLTRLPGLPVRHEAKM